MSSLYVQHMIFISCDKLIWMCSIPVLKALGLRFRFVIADLMMELSGGREWTDSGHVGEQQLQYNSAESA